jgi:hypothetical protein
MIEVHANVRIEDASADRGVVIGAVEIADAQDRPVATAANVGSERGDVDDTNACSID